MNKKINFYKCQNHYGILPRNLTWHLKMMVSKRNLLFQGLLFGFHVKFLGCTWMDDLINCQPQTGRGSIGWLLEATTLELEAKDVCYRVSSPPLRRFQTCAFQPHPMLWPEAKEMWKPSWARVGESQGKDRNQYSMDFGQAMKRWVVKWLRTLQNDHLAIFYPKLWWWNY